jgi:hypothetical protein
VNYEQRYGVALLTRLKIFRLATPSVKFAVMTKPKQEHLPEFSAKPEVLSFSGHETFVFRYGWLKKAVDAAAKNPRVFVEDDAIVVLGVGKNMVKSIRHWALATGVLGEEPKSRGTHLIPTTFGRFLFGDGGQDQYLEDPNSLWLLHWNLLSNPQRCTTWHWAFNMFPSNEFTRELLTQSIEEEIRRRNHGAMPSETTLKRDVDVFLRTYIPAKASRGTVVEDSLDCPLVELQLIEEIASAGVFQMRRGPKSTLNDYVFTYALTDFWDRIASHQESLPFSDIAYAKGSPGTTFKLDENSLAERLDRLEQVTEGDMLYTETAGLKQIYRKRMRPKFEYIQTYYQQTNPLFMVGA